MKVITQDCRLEDNFAMLLEISDLDLSILEEHPESMFSIETMQRLQQSKGNNAHIIQLMIKDDLSIYKYLPILLKCYDSVSWLNREHKFHIRRAKCHQFLQH